jgi:hypothetical protein
MQLANALTALTESQPTDLIPRSPEGVLAASTEYVDPSSAAENSAPVAATGISALLNAGRRRTSFGNVLRGSTASDVDSSNYDSSNSMAAFLPPAPPPIKTAPQLLNPHSAAPLKPVTPTKMSTSLGIAANGMFRSTSNTVKNMLMLAGNGNSSVRTAEMPPRPASSGPAGHASRLAFNASKDDDSCSNHSIHSDDSRNSLDEKLSSYYTADTDTGDIGVDSSAPVGGKT